jgi:hypothetical protein
MHATTAATAATATVPPKANSSSTTALTLRHPHVLLLLQPLAPLSGTDQFKLRDRALHVYAEKQRVPDFRDVCNGDAPLEEKLGRLGQLMDASHASCRCRLLPPLPPLLLPMLLSAGAAGPKFWGGMRLWLSPCSARGAARQGVAPLQPERHWRRRWPRTRPPLVLRTVCGKEATPPDMAGAEQLFWSVRAAAGTSMSAPASNWTSW